MAVSKGTLASLFVEQVARSAERVAFRTKRGGVWETASWADWDTRARAVAAELVRFGVQAGDRIAIYANTREEWVVADTAVLLVGAATVPIYPTLVHDQVEYILENSGAKVLFAEDVDALSKLLESEAFQRLEQVVLFEAPRRGVGSVVAPSGAKLPPIALYSELLRASRDETLSSTVYSRIAAVEPTGLATVMYTSGTTGPPKGVMLTHENFVFETGTLADVVDLRPTDEQLLLLPLAHIFGKLLMAMQIRVGYATAFAESLIKAMENAVEVNPTFMGCVPRLYEKIFAVANARAAQQGAIKKGIFDWASDIGRTVAQRKAKKEPISRALAVQYHYADKLALSKVRRSFGTKFRFGISGGAPLSASLAEWFFGAGVGVYEAYGLTEITGASNLNHPAAYKIGTVGKALPGVTVKLASDGEVLMRGPNNMRGYWNNDAATNEVLDADGFFHSGDVGVIDEEGFLSITDRKKDIIVTAGGKNVAPQNVENMLKQCSWVSQALIYGDKKPYLVALVSLNPDTLARYRSETGRVIELPGAATDPDIRSRVEAEIEALNARLSKFETIKRFAILADDLSIKGGELTPTLKLKRKVVTERHRTELEALYVQPGGAKPSAGER